MIHHIAVFSVHTCPLATLGGKETGGMNVYVRDLAREADHLHGVGHIEAVDPLGTLGQGANPRAVAMPGAGAVTPRTVPLGFGSASSVQSMPERRRSSSE